MGMEGSGQFSFPFIAESRGGVTIWKSVDGTLREGRMLLNMVSQSEQRREVTKKSGLCFAV